MTGIGATSPFRLLAEAVNQIVWVANPNGDWDYANARWCEYTGLSLTDSEGSGWLRAIHEKDRQAVQKQWQECGHLHKPFTLECRIRNADGIYRWFHIRVEQLDTVTLQWMATAEDISVDKSADDSFYDKDVQFRALANTAPTMLWVTDTNHLCTFISRGWYQFTGQTRAEALGVAWAEAAHPDDRRRVTRTFIDAANRRESFQREYRLRTVEGNYRWVLDAGRPRIAPNGEFLGYVGSITDVHDMKTAREEQQRMSELLHAVIDTTPDLVYVKDLCGRMLLANPAVLRAVGKPAEEMLGHSELEWLGNPEEGARIEANDLRIMECGRTEVVEEWMSTDQGSRLFVATKSPLRNEAGEVIGLVGISRDITEQKLAQQQMVESEARFRALADNIAQLAWMADERGHIFWYNRRWLDYTGTTFEELQISRWQKVHHPDHAERVSAKINRCIKTGEALEDTFPLRGADGQYRWFFSQAIPIRDESGQVTRWFGTHTDITEQREAAQALEAADKRKNEFLAMLAHELRNPLAPVHYAVEILRNAGPQEDVQAKARDMIDRQVAHMARLIDDLLDVSRITRGKIELRTEHCDLVGIVRKTVNEYRLSLEAVDLRLSCWTPDEPLWIDGDPTRLIQAIGNLLHNASKFTEPGGHVKVTLERDAATTLAVIRIEDNGIGIEEEMLSQLFEPFSQADQTLDRSKGGLGLGLSLVKGLVELHGGGVEASSGGVGQGSCFTLRLPLLASTEVIKTKPERLLAATCATELRILIIEDNRDTAESLHTLLHLGGHRVDAAFDGPSGIKLARRTRPDVILCDIGLPGGMDGYQVVRALRAEVLGKELPGREPQFFALSGYGQEADRRLAREAGFDRHFVKPVDYAELSQALVVVSQAKQLQC